MKRLLILVVFLSACATEPARQLPREFFDPAIESSFAQKIVDECKRYRFNYDHQDELLDALYVKLQGQGYKDSDYTAAARDVHKNQYFNDRLQSLLNRVDPSAVDPWCKAGDRERSRRSSISRYLLPA